MSLIKDVSKIYSQLGGYYSFLSSKPTEEEFKEWSDGLEGGTFWEPDIVLGTLVYAIRHPIRFEEALSVNKFFIKSIEMRTDEYQNKRKEELKERRDATKILYLPIGVMMGALMLFGPNSESEKHNLVSKMDEENGCERRALINK